VVDVAWPCEGTRRREASIGFQPEEHEFRFGELIRRRVPVEFNRALLLGQRFEIEEHR
jgi:hypothetical protein